MTALRLALAAALMATTQALMFKSDAVSKEWDTWVFVENGTYYGASPATIFLCWRWLLAAAAGAAPAPLPLTPDAGCC